MLFSTCCYSSMIVHSTLIFLGHWTKYLNPWHGVILITKIYFCHPFDAWSNNILEVFIHSFALDFIFSVVKTKIGYQGRTFRHIKVVTLNAKVFLLCVFWVIFRLTGMRSHFVEIMRPPLTSLSHWRLIKVEKATLEGLEIQNNPQKSSNSTVDSRVKNFFRSNWISSFWWVKAWKSCHSYSYTSLDNIIMIFLDRKWLEKCDGPLQIYFLTKY